MNQNLLNIPEIEMKKIKIKAQMNMYIEISELYTRKNNKYESDRYFYKARGLRRALNILEEPTHNPIISHCLLEKLKEDLKK